MRFYCSSALVHIVITSDFFDVTESGWYVRDLVNVTFQNITVLNRLWDENNYPVPRILSIATYVELHAGWSSQLTEDFNRHSPHQQDLSLVTYKQAVIAGNGRAPSSFIWNGRSDTIGHENSSLNYFFFFFKQKILKNDAVKWPSA